MTATTPKRPGGAGQAHTTRDDRTSEAQVPTAVPRSCVSRRSPAVACRLVRTDRCRRTHVCSIVIGATASAGKVDRKPANYREMQDSYDGDTAFRGCLDDTVGVLVGHSLLSVDHHSSDGFSVRLCLCHGRRSFAVLRIKGSGQFVPLGALGSACGGAAALSCCATRAISTGTQYDSYM